MDCGSSNIVWPQHRPFAVALSHDVDRTTKRLQILFYLTQAAINRQAKLVGRHLQSTLRLIRGDDPYWNFHRIMALEDDLGVRSTLFFLNESGRVQWHNPRSMILFWGRYKIKSKSIQNIIRQLDAGGWEIGLHGSYFSYQNEVLLKQEKQQLETIVDKPVVGSRQHYLNLSIPETWQMQANIGLRYDSTLGYADRIGFRWNVFHPFYPRDPLTGKEVPVLQIPLSIMDGPLMKMANPQQAALTLVNQVEQQKGVLVLDWHQRVFNPWEFKEWQDTYVHIIVECQQRGAWIATLREIADWWVGIE